MTPPKAYPIKESVCYFADKHNRRAVMRPIPLGDTITPQIEHIFSAGQCHALAVALHEILGWEVMGTYNPWGGGPRHTSHYVIRCPDRRGEADIHGIRCLDHGLRKASVDAILGGRVRGFLPPAMTFARHYAAIIAPDIQKQWEALQAGRSKPRWTLCSEGYADK